MNKFLEKIKELFRIGKKEQPLALDTGENYTRGELKERVKKGVETDFPTKRIKAEKDAMELVEKEVENYKKIRDLKRGVLFEDYLTSYAQNNKKDTEESFKWMMHNAYFKVKDALVEIYEMDNLRYEIDDFIYDSNYEINDDKKEELIEKIKGWRSSDNGETTVDYLKEKIKGNFGEDLHKYIEFYAMNEEQFIDKTIESTLEIIKLEMQRETEILPIKNGIQYAQINSFDGENYDLPEEMEEKYTDVEDYKKQEKERILKQYVYDLKSGSITEGQETILKEYLQKTILEKTAVLQTQEGAEKWIQEAINSGKINAEFTKFNYRKLVKIIMNTQKGVQMGPDKLNFKLPYEYYKKDEDGPYVGEDYKHYVKLVKYLEGTPKQKEQEGNKEYGE